MMENPVPQAPVAQQVATQQIEAPEEPDVAAGALGQQEITSGR